jgi:hypothetical protein
MKLEWFFIYPRFIRVHPWLFYLPARSQNSGARMNEPTTGFDDFLAWQKRYKILLQFFRGLIAGHSGF